jgi:hypothetical protein
LLKHPTLDQLHTLGLYGMAKAFADLAAADQANDVAHADWLALLLDREASWRCQAPSWNENMKCFLDLVINSENIGRPCSHY